MKPFDKVQPYPRGTVAYSAHNTALMWIKTDYRWLCMNTVAGHSEPSSFTDEHVRVWGYIVVLPPEPVLNSIRQAETRKRVQAYSDAVSAFQGHIALGLRYGPEDGCKTCKEAYRAGQTIEAVSSGYCPEGKKLYDFAMTLQNS